MNRKFISMILILSLCVSITGCSKTQKTPVTSDKDSQITSPSTNEINISSEKPQIPNDNNLNNIEITTTINLNNEISFTGSGVAVDDNKIIITSSGTYSINGKLPDGQIIVNAGDNDKVNLILNGVNLNCSNSAPIYIMNSDKTSIILADGTENFISDGNSYVLEDESSNEPNATIFSKDDLVIAGNGSLTVNANYKNGILSKDDLRIRGGNIYITAINDGLRGKDAIYVNNANINITCDGDGMKSTNIEESGKGYILIDGGTINIDAGQDGVQSDTNLFITGGDLNIKSGGGSENSSSKNDTWGKWGNMPNKFNPNATNNTTDSTISNTEDTTTSAKGIKASANIIIDGGNFNIDSSDDSFHSNNNLVINNGTFNIASGDDGIHSDSALEINSGNINITKSYEGIESKEITINDGNIHLITSDDGLNAAGGNDGSSINGRPGQNKFSAGNGKININGGYLYIDASGDGIDANGSITMTNGTVIVNGPTNNGNGSLDYDNSFDISSGLLIAAGSSGMTQGPSSSSSQNSISLTFQSQQANTIVHVESENGDEIITFAPSKTYQSVIISSPKIKSNETYNAYIGGTSTGLPTDGLYLDGEYSNGTKTITFTTSNTMTSAAQDGVSVGGMGGMGGGMFPNRDQEQNNNMKPDKNGNRPNPNTKP